MVKQLELITQAPPKPAPKPARLVSERLYELAAGLKPGQSVILFEDGSTIVK